MKKIFYISSIIVLSAIISGCAKEENAETPTPQVNEQGTHTVVIHAVDGTKTAINENEGQASFVWTTGEANRFTVKENGNLGNSLKVFYSNDYKILKLSATFVDSESPYTYSAFLAANKVNGNPTIPSKQNSTATSYDPDADILIAKDVTKVTRPDADNKLEMSFSRPLVVNKMTLKGLTAGETVKTIRITSDKPLTGTYNIPDYNISDNISEPSWTPTGSEIVISTNQEVPSAEQITVFFTTMPVEGATLSVNVITEGGNNASYFYEKTFNRAIDFSLNSVTKFGVSGLARAQAVAEVNNAGYATIEDAFAAANASETDCTIKLLADCTTLDANKSSTLVINNTSAAITLDLNGKTLTKTCNTEISGLAIEDGSSFSIIDNTDNEVKGKLILEYGASQANTHYTIIINSGGTLSVNKGEVFSNNSHLIKNSGSLSITGGKLHTERTNSIVINNYSGSNTNISGGEILGKRHGIYHTNGSLNISGGDITSTSTSTVNIPYTVYIANNSSIVSIEGGTFTSSWTTSTNANPVYQSGSKATVNITGGTYNIKAVNDIDGAARITCRNGNTVIDINGKNISTSTTQFIILSENSSLTIKDSNTDNKGSISSTANYVVLASNKENTSVTIEACNIISSYSYDGTISSTRKFTEYGSCVFIAGKSADVNENNILTIKEGAIIQSTGSESRALASQCATINLYECYITSEQYRAYDSTTASLITINDKASIYSTSSPAFYNRSTKSTGSIIINGGFFKGKDFAINAASNGNSIMSYNGGYFNCTDNQATPIGSNARPNNVSLNSTQTEHLHYRVEGDPITETEWYTIAE